MESTDIGQYRPISADSILDIGQFWPILTNSSQFQLNTTDFISVSTDSDMNRLFFEPCYLDLWIDKIGAYQNSLSNIIFKNRCSSLQHVKCHL